MRHLGMTIAVILCVVGCGERTVIVYQQPAPQPAPTTVYVEPAPHATYAQQPPPPPPPPQTVVYYADDPQSSEEVTTVIYREYYGYSDEEVVMMPHYRRYYHVDDDDLFFVSFVARQSHVSFDVAFNQFYFGCGGDYNRMLVVYNVSPAVFFVAVPPGAAYPAVYNRPYGVYRSQVFVGAQFSPVEFHALISLKIGVEYQGYSAEVFFRNTNTYGSPRRAMYQGRDRCGMGGHACAGVVYHPYVHPWTLSVSARASWHSDIAARQNSHEAVFREQHRDGIERVNRGEGYAAHRADHGPDHPGGPGQHPGDRPGDHALDHQADRPLDHAADRPDDHRGPADHPDDHRALGDPAHPQGPDRRQPGPDDQRGDDHASDHPENHNGPANGDQHANQQHGPSGNQPQHQPDPSSHKQQEKDDKGNKQPDH
jgi:hypothetical protein